MAQPGRSHDCKVTLGEKGQYEYRRCVSELWSNAKLSGPVGGLVLAFPESDLSCYKPALKPW